jgi:arylsulfatase A-like enzyme
MANQPNILLIMCDTLRKDILSVYGGPAMTPSLELLAKDSMVYQNAIAPSTWTLTSHISLFTNLYAGQHKVHEDGKNFDAIKVIDSARALKIERFPQWLAGNGYSSTGISNNPWISAQTGFDRGFEKFLLLDNQPRWIMEGIIEASKVGSSNSEILCRLLSRGDIKSIIKYGNVWGSKKLYDFIHNFPVDKGAHHTLQTLKSGNWDDKFFKFINFVEVHEPYRGEGDRERWGAMLGFQKQGKERAAILKREYVIETEYLDRYIGKIVELLKAKGEYDNTMIIVTSDHGQEFMEHGYMYHGIYVHDEIARIPLIIKYPRSKKFPKKNGYQSLNSINALIKSIVEGGDDGDLTTKTAMCESYGMCHVTPPRYMNEKADKDYSMTRIAVYEGNYKLTYNVTRDRAEELLLNGKPADLKSNGARIKDMFSVWRSMINKKQGGRR